MPVGVARRKAQTGRRRASRDNGGIGLLHYPRADEITLHPVILAHKIARLAAPQLRDNGEGFLGHGVAFIVIWMIH